MTVALVMTRSPDSVLVPLRRLSRRYLSMVPYDKRSTFAHCVRFALSGNLLLSIFRVAIMLPRILAYKLIAKEEDREVFSGL
jgi:hypothetical protein